MKKKRIKCYICNNDFKLSKREPFDIFRLFDPTIMKDACYRCQDRIRFVRFPSHIPKEQYKMYIRLSLKGCKI